MRLSFVVLWAVFGLWCLFAAWSVGCAWRHRHDDGWPDHAAYPGAFLAFLLWTAGVGILTLIFLACAIGLQGLENLD